MTVKTFGTLLGSYAITGDDSEKYSLYKRPDGKLVLVDPAGKAQYFKDAFEVGRAISTLTEAAEKALSTFEPKLVE